LGGAKNLANVEGINNMTQFLKLLLFFFCVCKLSFAESNSWHFTPADVNALHHQAADYRISYGASSNQVAELRIPKTKGLHPVVIIIHGGCWISRFVDLNNTATLADALRNIGFATWNVEYRRVDNVGGGWPGTFEDIANAADYLRNIKDKYSLDLSRVIVIGHSAGGHLALWLAARDKLPKDSPLYHANPLKLRGVISMGGVPDLAEFRSKQSTQICGKDVIAELLGRTEAKINAHYKEASPIALLPLSIPQILIYGTDDPVTPINIDNYVKRAQQSGSSIELIKIKYAGHHEYNVPNSVVWPTIQKWVLTLVE
jgi:acetyl esterase/lipase